MIKFSLVCENAHAFESWFASGAAYDQQTGQHLIACPLCGSVAVTKAIMAPAVANHLGRVVEQENLPPQPVVPIGMPSSLLDPRHRDIREAMSAIRTQILADTVDVGTNFPQEARKMHDGDSPERPIRGEASVEEVHALMEEGIKILPVPAAPEDLN
jgi:hypothetical protein